MTSSEYQDLTDFVVQHVGRIKDETQRVVEVTVEALRHDIRPVADGVLQNGRRIEENGRRIEANGLRIEENGRRIEALSGQVDTLTDRMDGLERSVSGR